MTTTRRRLDPDALAALEEERDFLLRSLDDLEAERGAGDLDDADYEALKDDYTRRAAEVLRSIDDQREAFASVPRAGWKRTIAWVAGLALLGALAGVLLARSSGDRLDGEGITGGVRSSIQSRLSQAQQLFADPENWGRAVEIYDSILSEDPTNTEALTYRSWLQYRDGVDLDAVLPGWAEAGRIDPTYADRIVFEAIALADAERWDDAALVLDDLDLDTAVAAIRELVVGRSLRGQVYAEARYSTIQDADAPTLGELGMDVDVALEAATYVLGTERPERSIVSLKLLRAVLTEDPDHPLALSREAFLLAQTGDPDLITRAMAQADRAVTANPDNVEALVTRASLFVVADAEQSCADLARVDEIVGDVDRTGSQLLEQASSLADRLGC